MHWQCHVVGRKVFNKVFIFIKMLSSWRMGSKIRWLRNKFELSEKHHCRDIQRSTFNVAPFTTSQCMFEVFYSHTGLYETFSSTTSSELSWKILYLSSRMFLAWHHRTFYEEYHFRLGCGWPSDSYVKNREPVVIINFYFSQAYSHYS